MSLFNWSTTPARKRADYTLPLIPNEIYLHIFDYFAPPTGPLTPGELAMFTKLSYVCRFFANHCLTRIFEYLEFSGSVFRDNTPFRIRHDAIKTSRENTLCTQIAVNQSLALAIAKTVRICRFYDWKLDDMDSWAVQRFANRFTNALSHMKHLRELTFRNSVVDARHGNAIATLGSLEKLVFDACEFVQASAITNVLEDGKRVKVSDLQVTACTGNFQAIVAIHPRYLRTLVVDMTFPQQVDWLGQSPLTELHLCPGRIFFLTRGWYLERLSIILARAPQSLELLSITFDDGLGTKYILLRSFGQHLRSSDPPAAVVLASVLDIIGRFTNLRSFRLRDHSVTLGPETPSAELRYILRDTFGPTSRLKCVDIFGRVFRSVYGEWSEVSCSVP
ncbi:hypothetical protein L210DRAFT_3517800 [Boletus edulis BED1]|uniref:F-box domain-containing protein n=1 Tax=Boletus edulis BED1 TaxID=1328754 RepID=A0AAD4C957_BOLED|nr:hypothetical protein L210DRAFT_3517800 [Boletus edulis BED1]